MIRLAGQTFRQVRVTPGRWQRTENRQLGRSREPGGAICGLRKSLADNESRAPVMHPYRGNCTFNV